MKIESVQAIAETDRLHNKISWDVSTELNYWARKSKFQTTGKDYKQVEIIDGGKPMKLIKIKESTHKKLTAVGKKGETYDELILRILKDIEGR